MASPDLTGFQLYFYIRILRNRQVPAKYIPRILSLKPVTIYNIIKADLLCGKKELAYIVKTLNYKPIDEYDLITNEDFNKYLRKLDPYLPSKPPTLLDKLTKVRKSLNRQRRLDRK